MLPTIVFVMIKSNKILANEINIEIKNGTNQPSTTKVDPIINDASFNIMTLLIGYNKPNDITVIGNDSNLNNGLTVLFNIIITIDVMMAYPNELI